MSDAYKSQWFQLRHQASNGQRRTGRARMLGMDALVMTMALAPALHGLAGSAQDMDPKASPGRGAELFEAQCALCHGATGRADGPASELLFPAARDFSEGRFKLASTRNGVPTDQDLVDTLRRGMPGSAMPGWAWMPEQDLEALALHVRELAVAGIVDDLRAESSDPVTELWSRARRLMTPGEPVRLSEAPMPSAVVLARGKQAFLANCAGCHGADGRGKLKPQADYRWPLDFTQGFLKGGSSHDDIDRRIQVGMHGTDMPTANIPSADRGALVAYVRSLIASGSSERYVQRREDIRAPRVAPGTVWDEDDDVRIVLSPLWWRRGSIHGAGISAMHDGTQVFIRIRWEDPSPDTPKPAGDEAPREIYSDSVALQLSLEDSPSIFGMGPISSIMNIWHWRATYVPTAGDLMPVTKIMPHRLLEWFLETDFGRSPLYELVEGPISIGGETVTAAPAGISLPGGIDPLPGSVSGMASWSDGIWEVIFSRPLEACSDRELDLLPGTQVAVNFAIWNGSAGDTRGQKSVSIWHRLQLAP